MVKQLGKFKKVLASALTALMVISAVQWHSGPPVVWADMPEPVTVLAGERQTKPKTLTLDMTAGLSVGEAYMDNMVSVGQEMPYTAGNVGDKESNKVVNQAGERQEVIYSGYVTNSTEMEKSVCLEPKYDGTVQAAGQLGSGKSYQIYAVTSGGASIVYEYKNESGTKLNILFDAFEVKKDVKYYISADTKMRLYLLSYTCEEAVEELPASDIPAFPGAEGGGKYITGGRGQEVITVTNLKDNAAGSIEGSLRWALMQAKEKGGATIVFDVSGNIELSASLRLDNIKNVTIAGQTAPGDGITLTGYDTNISNSENIIIRYLRFRPGAINVYSGGDSMDAMWGRDNKGFVIDHCSFSWNTDECLSLYRGEDGSVQWCLVYESLTLSGHSKGRHGYGAIAGGDNVTFHHNLYANHTSRNPRMGGGYAGYADAGHVAVVQMSNNLIYNWGFNTTYGGGYTYTNFVNNYSLAGPGTRDSVENWVINPGESSKVGGFYINGNYLANYTNPSGGTETPLITMDNIGQYGKFGGVDSGANKTTLAVSAYRSEDSTGPNAGIINKGFDEFIETGVEPAQSTYDDVLNKAGATYPRRDAIDARVTAEIANGLGRYVNTEYEVGGFLSEGNVIVEERGAGWDSDGDGMPDAWEEENGLNPEEAADGNVTSSLSDSILGIAGYTNVEVYLNSLVDMEHEAENPEAEIVSPANNAMLEKGRPVTVTVSADAKAGNQIEYAEFYYSTLTDITYIGRVDANGGTISCDLPDNIEDGSYFISARVYDSAGNATQTTAHEVHINTAANELENEGWSSGSIGDTDVEGHGSLENGVLSVKGNGKLGREEGSAGGDPANAAADSFHYVYREITGDVEITAKLEQISSVDNHAFAGIMVRDDLDADAASAALGLSWTKTDESVGVPWSMYLTGRDVKGGNFDYLGETLDDTGAAEREGVVLKPAVKFKNGPKELGYWMRLVRSGNTFTAYCSADGIAWEFMGSRTVEMDETVYVGFAAESNRAANEIEQINTARFSNIKINANIYDITYELENITIEGRPETVAEGNDIVLTLNTTIGYKLPEKAQVTIGDGEAQEIALAITDPLEGILTVENVTGAVKISARAVVDKTGVEQVEPQKIDEGGYLTVTEENGALILEQTATTGRITKTAGTDTSAGDLAQNVSYYVFPKTTGAQTMEADITILSRVDDTSTDKGLFVGVFEIGNGQEEFSSLGFRNVSGTSSKNGGLTAYWTKATGASGNGGSKCNNGLPNDDPHTKPSYELEKTYHVTFEKTKDGYKVSYQGSYADAASNVYPLGNATSTEMDLYKVFSDKRPAPEDEVQYGFALIGVTAKIENLRLSDAMGRTIYLQNDAPISVDDTLEDIKLSVPADGLTKEEIADELPDKVSVKYASGSYQELKVLWDTAALQDIYKEAAEFTVSGKIEGHETLTAEVKVILTIKDDPDDGKDDPDDGKDDPDDGKDDPDDGKDDPDDGKDDPDDGKDDPDDGKDDPDDSEDDTDDDYDDDTDDDADDAGNGAGNSSSHGLTDTERRLTQNTLGSGIREVKENSEGKLVIGTGNEIVFCEKDGTLSKDKWQKVSDSWYFFDADGRAVGGWLQAGGQWYYLDKTDKQMSTGWLKTADNVWYLLDEVNGNMKAGWQQRDGVWYLLDEVNGDMKTGWQQRNGKWYLLDEVNGDMKTGWHFKNGVWYYLSENGEMAENTITPDGYRVDDSGAWIQ